MLISPRLDSFSDGTPELGEFNHSATSFVKRTADSSLCHIGMAMPAGVIAFTIEGRIHLRIKLVAVQAMSGGKRRLQTKKILSTIPILGKKIVTLIEAHSMDAYFFADSFVDVTGEILGRNRLID